MGAGLNRLSLAGDSLRVYPDIRQRVGELDLVLGFGGYPSVPVLLAAWEQGIPIFLQEQNRVMGRANRLFARHAQLIFQGLPAVDKGTFPHRMLTGNPVRDVAPRDETWFKSHRLLVVFGGSQGARTLSRRLSSIAEDLIDDGWHIYHVYGKHGEPLCRDGEGLQSNALREREVNPDLPRVLACADCLWARAGAGTIAEIIRYRIPALLFPYPHAADDHQELNARWLEEVAPVKRISEKEIDDRQLRQLTNSTDDSPSDWAIPWDEDFLPQRRIVRELEQWT